MFSVSIHAPAWGATLARCLEQQAYDVSIHAPAWGATSLHGRRTKQAIGFNPRARVGRDLPDICSILIHTMFQSTRPRGARLQIHQIFERFLRFNPRARVGRDVGS